MTTQPVSIRVRSALRVAWARVSERVGWREALVAVGVMLSALGAGMVYRPAGYLVAGAVLLYIGLWHGVVLLSVAARARKE